MKDGAVRVILTTNFDRLIEQALTDVGITPTVVSSPEAAASAMPVDRTACTIVKVHGDYLDSRLLNTSAELGAYDERLSSYISRILDEHGLIIVGWSATWDPALRALVTGGQPRKFSTFWVSRGEVPEAAQDVINASDAIVLTSSGADEFLSALRDRVQSVRDLSGSSTISDRTAVATAKRLIGQGDSWVRVDDLVAELEAGASSSIGDPVEKGGMYEELVDQIETAYLGEVGVMAAIARWGPLDRFATVQAAIRRVSRSPRGGGYTDLLNLRRYPGTLLMYAVGTTLVAARRLELLPALLRTKFVLGNEAGGGISDMHLCAQAVLNWGSFNGIEARRLGADAKQTYKTPLSDHLLWVMSRSVHDVLPNELEREEAFEQFEILLSASTLIAYSRPLAGRFLWRGGGFEDGTSLQRLQVEARESGTEWPPVASGLFESVAAFEEAIVGARKTYGQQMVF